MATQPTQDAVPSESPRDLKFNAGKIDEFVTSPDHTYIDRFGVQHYTIDGMRWLAQQAIAEFGYITIDSFEDGNTITLPNQVLRLEATGEYYRWDGVFPKIVPAGSTPASTGGVSIGAWLSVGDGVLRGNLAAADGSDIVGFGATTVYNSIRRTPQFYGAMGDGVTDDTVALQAAIDNLDVFIPPGIYMFTTLNIPDDCVANGAGYKQVTLRQIAGTNATAITATASNFELTKFGIDCNYFTSSWNAAAGSLGNTTGNGLEVQGFGFTIDILLNNVAGVGAWFKNPGAENSASRIAVYDISIVGRDFGGEGIIIQGPNDGLLRKAWIGRAGILPRPAAESAAATSSVYSGAQVDGIVIDGANIEIGDVHTYACWSGTGFRTRNTVRLTEGGRVIAESSRAQVNISANTYGSAFFDVRSLSLLHPNWTGAIPAYTLPDASFDGVTIAASSGFVCRVTCKRTITQVARVVGSTAVVVTNDAQVDLNYSNSTAPSGDTEAGGLYSGIGLYSSSSVGGMLKVSGKNCNGDLVHLAGSGQTVIFNARTCTVGLRRVSPTNSLRGNNITGSVYRCTTGFVSNGQPASENIDLSMELLTGQVAFSGDAPSLDRAQNWNISASVNNVGYSTRQRLSANLDISTAGDKTVSIPHRFLYTPDFRQIQLTIDDRSTPTTSTVRTWVKDVTATDVVVGYRVDTGDSDPGRANLRVNVNLS
ncbi:glycosyl hydrolase family 28-related protein [Enterobacter asburiae]|uniref:tail fiber/spike domain-containing protein n=1 Tax=Enterobacter asburiae TaxID=61645 RepID=UPI0032AEF82D